MLGHTLGGYWIRRHLRTTSVGTVYEATDIGLRRQVDLTVLRPELAADRPLVARFREAARALGRINNPNVAAFYSVLQERGVVFATSQHVPGEPLDAVLYRRTRLPWPEACSVIYGVLEGLHAGHTQGIAHHDLGPDGVIATPCGNAKILDYGVAHALGTARTGGHAAGCAPDVQAAGALLHALLTGRAPGPQPAPLTDVPSWLRDVVHTALAPDCGYQTAGEMRGAMLAGASTVAAAVARPVRMYAGALQARLIWE